jgi:hypothetical protein
MTRAMHERPRDEVHARPSADAAALCGLPPDGKPWRTKRREVTCVMCLDEVNRRQHARGSNASPQPNSKTK